MRRNIARLSWTLRELGRVKKLIVEGNTSKIPQKHLQSYAKFVGLTVTNSSDLESALRASHENASKKVEVNARAVSSSVPIVKPVLVMSVEASGTPVYLYDPVGVDVLGTLNEGSEIDDEWSFASSVAARCGTNVALIPCPLTPLHLPTCLRATARVESVLRRSGMNIISKTTSDDVLRLCDANVPIHIRSEAPRDALKSMWALLTQVASHIDEDLTEKWQGSSFHSGMDVVSRILAPPSAVILIQLVRKGPCVNMVCLKPSQHSQEAPAKWSCSGTLSDVLTVLLQLPRHICLVPTAYTSRELLFGCRAALQRAGKSVTIVFSTQVTKALPSGANEVSKLWQSIVQDNGSDSENALLRIRESCGSVLREEYISRSEVALSSREGSGTEANMELSVEDKEKLVGNETADWLAVLRDKRRLAQEEAALANLTNTLFVAWTATDHASHGRPSNPHSISNRITGVSFLDHNGMQWESAAYATREALRLPSLSSYSLLVVHNAKDFLVYCWSDPSMQEFLRRGGIVWCPNLAEYLLSAQRCVTGKNTLRALRERYGAKLDPLSSDCLLMRAVFTAQSGVAVTNAQFQSILHRMDAMLAFATMEVQGIHVNKQEALRQLVESKNQLVNVSSALQLLIPAAIPMDFRRYFDWASTSHLHAYFFGGTVELGGVAIDPKKRVAHSLRILSFAAHFGVHLAALRNTEDFRTVRRLIGELSISDTEIENLIAKEQNETSSYRFISVDIESTGLNVHSDEIVDIAFYDPVNETHFSSLVNPMRKVNAASTLIHQLTQDELSAQPAIEDLLPSIANFLKPASPNECIVLVGHNVFSLDEPLLRRALSKSPDIDLSRIIFCDTLPLLKIHKARKGKPRLPQSLKLDDLASHFNVKPKGQLHRALTDAVVLWKVLDEVCSLSSNAARGDQAKKFGVAVASCIESNVLHPLRVTTRDPVSVFLRGACTGHAPSGKFEKLEHSAMETAFSDTSLKQLEDLGLEAAKWLRLRNQIELSMARLHQLCGLSLTSLHPDNCLRQLIDMTATSTSRTTSLYPSCQNIPKVDKSDVRKIFSSRYLEDGVMVEIDFAQLEIAVMANLCQDAQLVSELNSGRDFHALRASMFSGKSYDDIVQGHKEGDEDCKRLRGTAKVFSFQRLYGAGPALLRRTTGLRQDQVVQCIHDESNLFPGIAKFQKIVRAVALRPANPGLPTHFLFELPTGLRMAFRTRDCIHNLPTLKNYPIQGYGAELVQIVVGKLARDLAQHPDLQDKVCMVNFVHDSVWFDCKREVLEALLTTATATLRSIAEYVPRAFHGVSVPVPIDVVAEVGDSMQSLRRYPEISKKQSK